MGIDFQIYKKIAFKKEKLLLKGNFDREEIKYKSEMINALISETLFYFLQCGVMVADSAKFAVFPQVFFFLLSLRGRITFDGIS